MDPARFILWEIGHVPGLPEAEIVHLLLWQKLHCQNGDSSAWSIHPVQTVWSSFHCLLNNFRGTSAIESPWSKNHCSERCSDMSTGTKWRIVICVASFHWLTVLSLEVLPLTFKFPYFLSRPCGDVIPGGEVTGPSPKGSAQRLWEGHGFICTYFGSVMEKNPRAIPGRDGILEDASAPWAQSPTEMDLVPSAIWAPTSSWHRAMHRCHVAGGDLMSIHITQYYGGLVTRACYVDSPLGLTIPSDRWCYYSQRQIWKTMSREGKWFVWIHTSSCWWRWESESFPLCGSTVMWHWTSKDRRRFRTPCLSGLLFI